MRRDQGQQITGAFTLTIPTQIGTWSILSACLALGLIVSGRFGADALLMLGAVLAAFFARHAAGRLMRLPPADERRRPLAFWVTAYSMASALFAVTLAVVFERWLILLFVPAVLLAAGMLTVMEVHGKDRTAAGEILGMLGLSLAAAGALYTTTRPLTTPAPGRVFLCSRLFSGSVFHVRYLARRHAGWPSLVYHLLAPLAALGLALGYVVPRFGPLALLPTAAWALWAVGRRRKTRLPIRHIGYLEAAHTVVFVALAAWAFYQ